MHSPAAAFTHLYWQLLPGICLCCRQDSKRRIDLCIYCDQALPYLRKRNPCRSCALPQEEDSEEKLLSLCASCISNPKLWGSLTATFVYEDTISRWIQLVKYHSALVEQRLLGTLMARNLASENLAIDTIIPVPLSWQRLWRRGHNQSSGLARTLSRQLKIPLRMRALRRVRHTPAQQRLSRSKRLNNLKGAFKASTEVAGKRIALIDDVVTTGTTVTQATKALLAAGAREVHVWAAARVLR